VIAQTARTGFPAARVRNLFPQDLRLLALVIACASLFAHAAPSDPRIALVIGNAEYKSAPLKNLVNDARKVAAAHSSKHGMFWSHLHMSSNGETAEVIRI
jgi:hypothetical protein